MYAVITGAGSGIGREIAIYLAELGYDLVLVGRSEEKLKKTAEAVSGRKPGPEGLGLQKNTASNAGSADGPQIRILSMDLAHTQNCFRLYEETQDLPVGFLVNNAGFGVYGPFEQTDLNRELDLISVNVTAVHVLTKLFLRRMRKNGDAGVILNVGSAAGFTAGPVFSSYYASKNYVVRLTEAIHEELRREKSGVRISVLCPGPVRTDFNRNADIAKNTGGLSARYVARCGVDGARKGKMIITPGCGMKAVKVLTHFGSEELITRLQYLIQSRKGSAH